jgi:hypothetical protein
MCDRTQILLLLRSTDSSLGCKCPKGNWKQEKSLASLSPFYICLALSITLQPPWDQEGQD